MSINTTFDSFFKSLTLGLLGSVLLVACGDANTSSAPSAEGERTSYENADDHALGDVNAPITVVEYASVVCPACANWATTVWPDFRTKFVDTGKVRFVFREFPTPPVDLAMAGHLIANCAAEDKFFDVIHIQFKRQREILGSSDIKGEYVDLAKSAGMSEADFETCMSNEEEIARLNNVIKTANDLGVTGTPTFFINGTRYSSRDAFAVEDFEKIFAEILGEAQPEETPDASQEADQ